MKRSSAPSNTPPRALHPEAPQEFAEEGQDGFEKAYQHFAASRRHNKPENVTTNQYWNNPTDHRWKSSREYPQYSSTNPPWSTNAVGGHGVMQEERSPPDNNASAASSYNSAASYYGGYYDQYQYQQYQQSANSGSMRICDGTSGGGNPSNGAVDHHRRQTRSGYDPSLNTGPSTAKPMAVKREHDAEPNEMEGDNFGSIFTKSLTSLYSQDAENAYAEQNDPDIMICDSVPNSEDASYQRLGSANHYNLNANANRPPTFGYYDNNRPEALQNEEPGPIQLKSNSFRYDRPSFDDMHLYASSQNPVPNKSQQAKKRKMSMPNLPPEGFPNNENRNKKLPKMHSFKSDSKWTPNSCSFSAFNEIAIKEEPMDDYPVHDDPSNSNRKPLKEGCTPASNKIPNPQEHPKPVARKRSPAATCFDKFDKGSSKTSKKISPLSAYAKVQDSIVVSLKCRRYKKRTKPAPGKDDGYPTSKDEVDGWKRTGAYYPGVEQAVRHVIGELLERVTQCGDRHVSDLPEFSEIGTNRVREMVYQFCQRYSLDFNDFDDLDKVLKPCLVTDKPKTSERTIIRKRTSTSPIPNKTESVKAPKPISKKTGEITVPPERRVLRRLPGREERGRQTRRRRRKATTAFKRRYSTRSVKDTDNEDAGNSEAEIVIDSSSDRESCKEETIKKMRESKKISGKSDKTSSVTKSVKNQIDDEPKRTKHKRTEKCKDTPDKDIQREPQKKRWARVSKYPSDTSQSSSSVEEVKNQSSKADKSEKSSSSDSSDKVKTVEHDKKARVLVSSEKSSVKKAAVKMHKNDTGEKSSKKDTSEISHKKESTEKSNEKRDSENSATIRKNLTSGKSYESDASEKSHKRDTSVEQSKNQFFVKSDTSDDSFNVSPSEKSCAEEASEKVHINKATCNSQGEQNSVKSPKSKTENSVDERTRTEKLQAKEVENSKSQLNEKSHKNDSSEKLGSETERSKTNRNVELPQELIKSHEFKSDSSSKSNTLSSEKSCISQLSPPSTPLVAEKQFTAHSSDLVNLSTSSVTGNTHVNPQTENYCETLSTSKLQSDESQPFLSSQNRYTREEPEKPHLKQTLDSTNTSVNVKPGEVSGRSRVLETSKPIETLQEVEKLHKSIEYEKLQTPVAYERSQMSMTSEVKFGHTSVDRNASSGGEAETFPKRHPDKLDTPLKIQRPIPIYCNRPPMEALGDSPPFLRKMEILDPKLQTGTFDPKLQNNWRVNLEDVMAKSSSRSQFSGTKQNPDSFVRCTPSAPMETKKFEFGKLEPNRMEPVPLKKDTKSRDFCTKESRPPHLEPNDISVRRCSVEMGSRVDSRGQFDGPPSIPSSELYKTDFLSVPPGTKRTSEFPANPSNSIRSFGTSEKGAFEAVSLTKKTYDGLRVTESSSKGDDYKKTSYDAQANDGHTYSNDEPIYLGKPPELVLMKDIKKELIEDSKNGDASRSRPPSSGLKDSEMPAITFFSRSQEKRKSLSKHKDLSKGTGGQIIFSDSDDSDGGLVIDLDGGQVLDDKSSGNTVKDSSPNANPPILTPLKKEESHQWDDDDDCIILTDPSTNEKIQDRSDKSIKDDRDESILRTLLLETGEVINGSSSSQDMCVPSQQGDHSNSLPEADSKANIGQEVMKLLMYQSYHDASSCSSSPGFTDDKKHALEKLSPGPTHEDIIVGEQEEKTECTSRDPRRQLKEKIKKLRNEILYLQCMAEQKDKERTAIICFKRYKEEILKRLLKEYAFNVQDHVRVWIKTKQENVDNKNVNTRPSPPTLRLPATESQDITPQPKPAHSRAPSTVYHSIHKGDQPSTSRSPPQQHYAGEKLPTVETLIAKATENYGVDMRTMRNSSSSSTVAESSSAQTILKKVLSSKESYSPHRNHSPSLPDTMRSKSLPSQPVQKTYPKQYEPVNMMTKHSSRGTNDIAYDARVLPKPYEATKSNTSYGYPLGYENRLAKSKPYDIPKLLASCEYPSPFDSRAASKPYDIPTKSSTKCEYPLPYDNRTMSKSSYDTSKSSAKCDYSSGYGVSKTYVPKPCEYPQEYDNRTSTSKSYDTHKTNVPCDYSSEYNKSLHYQSNSLKSIEYDAKERMKHASPTNSYWSIQAGGKVTPADVNNPDTLKREYASPTRVQAELSGRKSSSSHAFSHPTKQASGVPIKSEQHHERSLKSSVERIYNRKSEEERRALAYPSMTGPTSKGSVPYGGHLLGQQHSGQNPMPKQPCPNTTSRCNGCGSMDAKFLCSGCRKHWYCSSQCQTLRWPEHSRICTGSMSTPPL